MSRQNVNPNFKFGDTDGFMLTDIDSDQSLMLIPCDTAGNFSWTGVTRAPLERNAMQTSNTSNQYSDLQRPWISIPQEDWGGGRGNAIFTKDTTRYSDGKRAQAAFQECIFNGPLDYYSDGAIGRAVATNCPGSLYWEKVSGSKKYIAVKFTCGSVVYAGEVYIHLRRRGTPESALVVDLVTSPDATSTLATHSFTTSEITDTLAEFKKFSFSNIALTEGATYYVRVHSDSGTTEDYWEVGCRKGSDNNTTISSDGTSFSLINFEMYFRVAVHQNNYRCKFFTYEQLQFTVRQQGENGTPVLLMNGDIGKATSGGNTTITDTGKSWTANQWKGARIGLVYQTGSQDYVSCWKTISSNTATEITVDSAWTINPAANTTYIINDTPLWQTITGHGLTAHVTDVHVINGVVYFAQGDATSARVMRWYDGAFQFKELTGIYATYFQSVRDSECMMLYRARNDGINHKRTVERSILLDWQASATSWNSVSTALSTEDKATELVSESATITEATNGTSKSISRTTTTKVGGVLNTTVTESQSSSSTTANNVITTEESSSKTTEINNQVPLRISVATESKDFTTCDYDSKQYVITISNFASENNTGGLVITLQESEDGNAWNNVQSVTAVSAGTWRIFAHCQYRYRRFVLTAIGTNCTVNNIAITTSQIPHFEDPVILQDNYGKITRLFEYGAEMTKSLWIVQEGMLSSINKVEGTTDTYTHDRINIDELQTTAEQFNGKAMTTVDVYLAWGWLNGLQRYYNTQLEGKGPDHDEGLPFDRQGRVTQIISYPSNFFISIDAGSEGYSSVMQFNQSGWHEIYRAPNVGERIFDMGFQPIYGDRPDRLWVNVGDDIIWLAMPSKILYAIQDKHAEYTHESVLVSAWHTAGMTDIEKLWQTLKIMADYLDGVNCWIEADYQTDEEGIWHPIENWYTESPSQKWDLNERSSVNGKKLRYRLRLQTTDMYKTPKVNVVVLEAVGRVDIKMSYNFYFRNIKYKRDLNAEFEDIEPLDVQDVLDEWANTLKKLRLNSRWKIFDNKIVYLDAVQTSVLNELSEGYIGQITLNEL